jgi:hypothetical protein
MTGLPASKVAVPINVFVVADPNWGRHDWPWGSIAELTDLHTGGDEGIA